MSKTTRRVEVKMPEKSKEKPLYGMKYSARPEYGFSLVELLVVVAILAILAAIAIPLFLNQTFQSSTGCGAV